ncbi:MAG: hypothetical protein VX916_01320 [Planctomycetota bacterium]|nr:hypothetical protein [Planctomycetota bacterium]
MTYKQFITHKCLTHLMWLTAILGMVSCATVHSVRVGSFDRDLDQYWALLEKGDIGALEVAFPQFEEGVWRERCHGDLIALRNGRAAARRWAEGRGAWLEARFDASRDVALSKLQQKTALDKLDAVEFLEFLRRSTSRRFTEEEKQRVGRLPVGALEGQVMVVLSLLRGGDPTEAKKYLAQVEGDGARLRMAWRNWEAATGQWHLVVEGVLADLADGMAVPSTLGLAEAALTSLPMEDLERRMLEQLGRTPTEGVHMERAVAKLEGQLLARAGRFSDGQARLQDVDVLLPDEEKLIQQWAQWAGGTAGNNLRGMVESDEERTTGSALFATRVTHEWDLIARRTYSDELKGDGGLDFDEFLGELDNGVLPIPHAPQLTLLPRQDYGIFGEILNASGLEQTLPGIFVMSGKGLGLPPDLTAYENLGRHTRDVEEEPFQYDQCFVRGVLVPSFVMSMGLGVAGAGVDRLVFLDLDVIERSQRYVEMALRRWDLESVSDKPLPLMSRQQPDDMSDPLDVALRLHAEAAREGGDAYPERVLETYRLHEEKHILDFHEFMRRGVAGRFALLIQSGLSPQAIRATIERRAQLYAIQRCSDPRIALAQAIEYLPVEGPLMASEHAVGYASVVKDMIEMLLSGKWNGAQSLGELGLDGNRSILQQLHRLDRETIRALATSFGD